MVRAVWFLKDEGNEERSAFLLSVGPREGCHPPRSILGRGGDDQPLLYQFPSRVDQQVGSTTKARLKNGSMASQEVLEKKKMCGGRPRCRPSPTKTNPQENTTNSGPLPWILPCWRLIYHNNITVWTGNSFIPCMIGFYLLLLGGGKE